MYCSRNALLLLPPYRLEDQRPHIGENMNSSWISQLQETPFVTERKGLVPYPPLYTSLFSLDITVVVFSSIFVYNWTDLQLYTLMYCVNRHQIKERIQMCYVSCLHETCLKTMSNFDFFRTLDVVLNCLSNPTLENDFNIIILFLSTF